MPASLRLLVPSGGGGGQYAAGSTAVTPGGHGWAPAQCDSSPAKSKAVAGLAWLYPAHTDVAREWAATGPALVVLTLGAAGAHAYWRGGHVAVPGRRVAVVDTVGAGDAFMAGLLSGLMMRGLIAAGPGPARGERARQALQRATAGADPAPDLGFHLRPGVPVAALTCMREGAAPPTLVELKARYATASGVWRAP
ncbi:PfkB family carbohydrate kinase [Streptomyces sp. NPDC056132]|uniref:PfkB family carbohydrate kinase n=1 Tax=Streptomyces sp. NPDC056132 TaxID=3345722 RepID=UPI0035E2ED0F